MANEGARGEFIDFLESTIAWFKQRADRSHGYYNGVRMMLVVFSAALPALTANNLTLYSTVVAVLVAALAGLDTQFKPGEQWKHHRSIQLVLMRLKREYDLASSGPEDGAAFEALRKSVEEVLSAEANDFWTFRVAPWASQSK